MKLSRFITSRAIKYILICICISCILSLFGYYLNYTAWIRATDGNDKTFLDALDNGLFISSSVFMIAIIFFIIQFVFFGFIALFIKRLRIIPICIWTYVAIQITVLFLAGFLIGNVGNERIRAAKFRAMERAAMNSNPVIQAILNFEKDQKRAPKDLNELVPKYLAGYPKTGVAVCPELQFGLTMDARLQGNPWSLSMTLDDGPPFHGYWIEFWPKQNYKNREGMNLIQCNQWTWAVSRFDG